MKWISVRDKLPEINISEGDFVTSKSVIALFMGENEYWCESVSLKLFYEDDEPEWYFDYDGEMVTRNKITHWMPLPEPPNNQTL